MLLLSWYCAMSSTSITDVQADASTSIDVYVNTVVIDDDDGAVSCLCCQLMSTCMLILLAQGDFCYNLMDQYTS
jgi:hypothetical protein